MSPKPVKSGKMPRPPSSSPLPPHTSVVGDDGRGPADFTHTLTVRYAECDGQGVVFNTHYQAFCDAVLDLWLRQSMGAEWSLTIGGGDSRCGCTV